LQNILELNGAERFIPGAGTSEITEYTLGKVVVPGIKTKDGRILQSPLVELNGRADPASEENTRFALENMASIDKAIGTINEQAQDIDKKISGIFTNHRYIKDNYKKTLRDIVEVYIFALLLKNSPEEYVQPFRSKLKEIIDARGIEIWAPEIGKPAPDGCEKTPAEPGSSYPPGTVTIVHTPGFRLKEGERYETIAKPQISVVPDNYEVKKEA
jgi:molecular chaperone GrpE (heat shock protein)